MPGKLCQPGMSWDQVLEMLSGVCKGVRNEVDLPKCHEHMYPHPCVPVCRPFPNAHLSWPFLLRLLIY